MTARLSNLRALPFSGLQRPTLRQKRRRVETERAFGSEVLNLTALRRRRYQGQGFSFSNTTGRTNTAYAAGPGDEMHGLFGKITANPAGTNQVQATLTGGVLVINGSRNDDHIDVDLSRNGEQILVLSDNQQIGSFDLVSVSRIEFKGWAGDDHIAIVNEIAVPMILDGGAGNDNLNGGRGNNILLGGPGDDDLRGSINRDILIGGEGSDRLQAGSNDDLLIGGTTVYDNNVLALLQILGEWDFSPLIPREGCQSPFRRGGSAEARFHDSV